MKVRIRTASLLVCAVAAIFAAGCTKGNIEQVAGAEQKSPHEAVTDPRLAAGQKMIESAPGSPKGHLMLASYYINRARQTGDFSLNAIARDEVEKALTIEPADVNARKLRASLHLTYHEFAQGLQLGNELAAELPDDSFVLGVITDAQTQLGNYPEAVQAAKKMIDAKPNAQSYARVAYLRYLHGDYQGAVQMYKLAARTTDPGDKEGQSWCLTQLGDLHWRNGKYDDAAKVYDEALAISPNYPLAMLGRGRVYAALGDLRSAVSLMSGSVERSPHTGSIILYGDVLHRIGQADAAENMYALANNADVLGDTHDAHRIALSWADRDIRLDEALKIAEADYSNVKDIYAADILAWCLYKNGRYAEARVRSAEALRIGTGDAVLYYHAGMIEKALGNRSGARRLLRKALALNPGFDLRQALIAIAELAEID